MKRLGTVLVIAVVLFAGLSPRATAVQTHKIFVNGLWLSYVCPARSLIFASG